MAKTDAKQSNDLNDIKSAALQTANEVAERVMKEAPELAAEATAFIRKNPWTAVLGAAAIGYFLGVTRSRPEPYREPRR